MFLSQAMWVATNVLATVIKNVAVNDICSSILLTTEVSETGL